LSLNYEAREKHLRDHQRTATISTGIVLLAAVVIFLIFLAN